MDKVNLEKMHELLSKEIQRIVEKGDLTPSELDNANKAICLVDKIEEMLGEKGYSEMGRSYGPMYDYSWEHGRSPVTGRYVGRDGSYMRGKSGHSIKDRMISKLEHMMDETDSEYERNEISSYIRKLESNK